jgi:hypothetical protein
MGLFPMTVRSDTEFSVLEYGHLKEGELRSLKIMSLL